MTWVKIDDMAPLHPKFFRAGMAAYGWHCAALAYCNRQLTDGFIPSSDLALVYPGGEPDQIKDVVATLCREGLLHVVEGGVNGTCRSPLCHRFDRVCRSAHAPHDAVLTGYLMHDYLDYQPSRREVISARQHLARVRAEAGRQGGKRSGETRRQKGAKKTEANDQATCFDVASDLLEAKRSPGPTRPDASLPTPRRSSQRSRTHVVLLDDQRLAELRPCYPGIDVDREAGKWRAWLLTPKGRGKQPTLQRFVAWLNRCEPITNGSDPYADWPRYCRTCDDIHKPSEPCRQGSA